MAGHDVEVIREQVEPVPVDDTPDIRVPRVSGVLRPFVQSQTGLA